MCVHIFVLHFGWKWLKKVVVIYFLHSFVKQYISARWNQTAFINWTHAETKRTNDMRLIIRLGGDSFRIFIFHWLTYCRWTRAIYESLDAYKLLHNDLQRLILVKTKETKNRLHIFSSIRNISGFGKLIEIAYPCDYKCHTKCTARMLNWPHMAPYLDPGRQLGIQRCLSFCSNVFPRNVSNLLQQEKKPKNIITSNSLHAIEREEREFSCSLALTYDQVFRKTLNCETFGAFSARFAFWTGWHFITVEHFFFYE